MLPGSRRVLLHTEQVLEDEKFEALVVAGFDETFLRCTIISPHFLHEVLENLAAAGEVRGDG